MVDNLFVVESPLQALVAVELSLRFKSEKNGVIYRLIAGREKNNQQIEKVIKNGNWILERQVLFDNRGGVANHISIQRALRFFDKEFSGNVNQLFIGEFRSQWMHFMRSAVGPKKTILMDDGAATLLSKRKYIDKGIYFPKELWETQGFLKTVTKKIIYRKFLIDPILKKPIFFASAFLGSESIYPVNFSEVKKLFKSKRTNENSRTVFFFGSKYSEARIISLEYEIDFLRKVKGFYSNSSINFIYCAHRDESKVKLNLIESELKLKVVTPELPAEIFLLEQGGCVSEIAGAYSSVLNNAKVIFPNIMVRAFYLSPDEIDIKNRDDIFNVYQHYKVERINVEFLNNY